MVDTPNPDKTVADARAADAKAMDAQAKANDATKSKEQIAADKARDDADNARAKAAEEAAKARQDAADANTTVASAKVLAPVDGDMDVGHHMAQKFGNDPRNPKLAPGLADTDEARTVKLTRVTPDSPDLVTTYCHPEMVGDYLRAGWNVA